MLLNSGKAYLMYSSGHTFVYTYMKRVLQTFLYRYSFFYSLFDAIMGIVNTHFSLYLTGLVERQYRNIFFLKNNEINVFE